MINFFCVLFNALYALMWAVAAVVTCIVMVALYLPMLVFGTFSNPKR